MHVRPRKLSARLAVRTAVVLAVTAATVVTTATASFASNSMTVDRTHGPSGGGYSIILTPNGSTDFSAATGANVAVQFNIASSCPAAAASHRPTPVALGLSGSNLVNTGIVEALVTTPSASSPLTVPVPAGLALPAGALSSATFSVCVYDTGTGEVRLGNYDAGFTLDANVTSNPTSGASGGGYPITLTADSAVFTAFSSSAHTVQFQAATTAQPTCAAAPLGASAPTASNATTMTGGVIAVPSTSVQVPTTTTMTVNVPAALAQVASPKVLSANYNICVYKTAGGALLAETTTANQFNLDGNVALSTTSGSSAGGNSVSLTAATPIFTAGQIYTQLQTAGSPCANVYATSGAVNVTTTRFISTSKIAITLPTSGLPPSTTTSYEVCVYSDNTTTSGNTLVAQGYGTYTVGQVPTVTSVYPTNGPAEGGSTITVSGANFPTAGGAMTATVGGAPLSNIVVASSGLTFTATVPPHAAGPAVSIAVTTAGGTSETKSLFTFTNGITITPKTGANTAMSSTDLDITGVGFADLTFGTAFDTNSTKAHVYLVKGAYDPTGTTTKANGQVSGGECINVLVISDKDLVCSLYLGGNLAVAPTATTRTLTGCASYTSAAGTTLSPSTASLYLGPATATSTGCTLTAADVGMKISAGTTIPDNTTTIASVTTGGIATLSKTALVTATTSGITLSSSRTVADAVFSTNTVTSTNAPFSAGDVGKMISGTGIPAGTYITAVSTVTATLSQTPSTPSGNMTIYTPTPIPNGTYTITVVNNGAPGAQSGATYMKSIISSGSTFTVADY